MVWRGLRNKQQPRETPPTTRNHNSLLAKVLCCEGNLTLDTNTIVATILDSTNPKDAAQRRFQKFGSISHIDLLPGAVPVVSVTFYDVRAAALAVAANKHALWGSCRPGPQTGARCVQISGESYLSPKALTGVSKLECNPNDDSGNSYTVEFFDIRDAEAQKKREAESKQKVDEEAAKTNAEAKKKSCELLDSELWHLLGRISTLAGDEAQKNLKAKAKAKVEEQTKTKQAEEGVQKAEVEAKKDADAHTKTAVEEEAIQKAKEDADNKKDDADRRNVCLLGRVAVGQKTLQQTPGQDMQLLRQASATKQA